MWINSQISNDNMVICDKSHIQCFDSLKWGNFVKDRYNILFAVFSIIFIVASIFSVYADSSNSSNLTNSTNTTNVTRNLTQNAIVQPMSLSTSISVTPQSVSMGPWDANGDEHYVPNAATVQVNASNFILGGDGTLSVRATGDFTSSTSSIPLSNFKYECLGNVSKTLFTTTNSQIDSYSPPIIGTIRNTYHINYYLTVPVGVDSGTYSTTIIYTAT